MNFGLRHWVQSCRPRLLSFRFLFTLMYLGVIGAIAYSNTILNCGRKLLGGGAGVLMIFFLLLVGLEQLEHWRYRYEAPRSVAIALLLARMILFEGVGALDCSVLSIFSIRSFPSALFFCVWRRCRRAAERLLRGRCLGQDVDAQLALVRQSDERVHHDRVPAALDLYASIGGRHPPR